MIPKGNQSSQAIAGLEHGGRHVSRLVESFNPERAGLDDSPILMQLKEIGDMLYPLGEF